MMEYDFLKLFLWIIPVRIDEVFLIESYSEPTPYIHHIECEKDGMKKK